MEDNQKENKVIKKSTKVWAWIGNAILYWIALAMLLAGTQGAQNVPAFAVVGLVALAGGIILSVMLAKIFRANKKG